MQSKKKTKVDAPAAVTIGEELDISSDSEAGMSEEEEEEEVSSGKYMPLLFSA